MKKITFLMLLTVSLFVFNACSEDDSVRVSEINYVGFEKETLPFGVDYGSNTSKDIKVYSGSVSSSDRTFNVAVNTDKSTADPSSYTVPATVTIPGGTNVGTMSVNVKDVNIGPGKKLVLSLVPAAGLQVSKSITLNLTQICPFNDVKLAITFDDYSEETSWELLDAEMNVIDSAEYPAATPSAKKSFCLQAGTYTFVIYDVYGDGFCCSYGNGSYKVTLGDVVLAQGKEFGESEATTFTLP